MRGLAIALIFWIGVVPSLVGSFLILACLAAVLPPLVFRPYLVRLFAYHLCRLRWALLPSATGTRGPGTNIQSFSKLYLLRGDRP
jgi:hypothetical protein